MSTVPRAIWEVDALLGEGPVWLPDRGVLAFVDIKAGNLHTWHPGVERGETPHVGGNPSFLVPDRDGGLVYGPRDEIVRLTADGARETLARTAYVTTARTGLSAEQLAQQPQAGGLFTFETGIPGRALPPVRLH